MPFTRYFAQERFDAGWTLASEGGLIIEQINELRIEYRLPPSECWPMATFTLTVRHLLTNIANLPGFVNFTPEDVRQALLASGYLRLEYVRAKLVASPEAV